MMAQGGRVNIAAMHCTVAHVKPLTDVRGKHETVIDISG